VAESVVIPRRVAIAVVVQRESALVGCRTHPPFQGYSEFPGGKVRPGETPERAAVREVREECGIEIEIECLLCTRRTSAGDGDLELRFFLCRPRGDTELAPARSFRWVSLCDLGDLVFPPANEEVVAMLRSRR
jgi:8-oxo-dGTP diphosphatase